MVAEAPRQREEQVQRPGDRNGHGDLREQRWLMGQEHQRGEQWGGVREVGSGQILQGP